MSANTRYSPLIGVGVLVWREHRLLLGKRPLADGGYCWQFPGGHLEKGEAVFACAAREVFEETGLRLSGPRQLGFTDRVFQAGGHDYLTLMVSADCEAGEPQLREPDKCLCWQWFDYRQLPSPLFEPIGIFLEAVSAQQSDLYRLHCEAARPALP